MPGHTRSIYSRRQRMAPGQYDNPLADFLDRLPGYFNQYQQNQLALGRQQLADRRYEDAQEQQEFRNELSLAGLLDGSDQAKFLESSSNPMLQRIGASKKASEDTFQSLIEPDDMSEDNASKVSYFQELLKNPSVSGNPTRENQVKSRIANIQNTAIRKNINEIVSSDPTNNSYKIIAQKALVDAPGAYKDILELEGKKIKTERKIITDAAGRKRYVEDGTLVFPEVVPEEKDKFATPTAILNSLQNQSDRLLLEYSGEGGYSNPEFLKRKADLEARIFQLTGQNLLFNTGQTLPDNSEQVLPPNRFGAFNTSVAESTSAPQPPYDDEGIIFIDF